MAYGKFKNTGGSVNVDMGSLNPKQKLFCQARTRYVGYGGARGGGKTHVSRVKAFGGALTYPGIKILFVRREYPELEQTVILPMRKMIPSELASYNSTMHMFFFANGSTIKFGHYGDRDDVEYQGQEYDWIFVDEATQFTEAQFRTLGACLRGGTKIPRRMYLTCNPGGSTGVAVTASDCPGGDCVRTGAITQSGESIVCLPARVVIQLEGGTDSGVDAVIG